LIDEREAGVVRDAAEHDVAGEIVRPMKIVSTALAKRPA